MNDKHFLFDDGIKSESIIEQLTMDIIVTSIHFILGNFSVMTHRTSTFHFSKYDKYFQGYNSAAHVLVQASLTGTSLRNKQHPNSNQPTSNKLTAFHTVVQCRNACVWKRTLMCIPTHHSPQPTRARLMCILRPALRLHAVMKKKKSKVRGTDFLSTR